MAHGYCKYGRLHNLINNDKTRENSKLYDWKNEQSLHTSLFISMFSLADTKEPIKPKLPNIPTTLDCQNTTMLRDPSGSNLCQDCKRNRFY